MIYADVDEPPPADDESPSIYDGGDGKITNSRKNPSQTTEWIILQTTEQIGFKSPKSL